MEPDQQFEIQLGHICNNRCVFCVSGQMTELRRAAPIDAAAVCAELDRARALGIGKVTLLGGEPTIQRSFMDVLRHAVEAGFAEIVIFTNGVRLWRREWIEKVIDLGARFTWRISLQGGNEETHDATTIKRGAFRKIVTGMGILAELDQTITCNMCVVEQNYRSLADLPALARRFPIRQFHLDMVRPRDAGERSEDYLDGIMPDYEDLARVLRQMLEGFDALDPAFDINIGNLPYCLLPEFGHRIHHDGEQTYTVAVSGDNSLSAAWDKYEDKRTDKVKLEACGGCVFDHRCSGIFDLYLRRRGHEAFAPVDAATLRERDPHQRLFCVALHGAVAALQAAPPPGWSWDGHDDDELAGWIRPHLRGPAGESVTLLLEPSAAPGGGDGEHDDFVLRLERADGVNDATAAALLSAAFDTLAAQLSGAPRARPSLQRLRARRQALGPESPVPRGIQRRLRQLAGAGAVDGWRVRAAAPIFAPLGARVVLTRGAERAELRFERTLTGRTAVRWHRPAPDPATQAALARAVAVALGHGAPSRDAAAG